MIDVTYLSVVALHADNPSTRMEFGGRWGTVHRLMRELSQLVDLVTGWIEFVLIGEIKLTVQGTELGWPGSKAQSL